MNLERGTELHLVMTDLVFPESPRWRDGRPWVSDWGVASGEGRLLRQEPDGSLVAHAELPALGGHPWNGIVNDGRGKRMSTPSASTFPGGTFAPGSVTMARPHGSVRLVAEGPAFPTVVSHPVTAAGR